MLKIEVSLLGMPEKFEEIKKEKKEPQEQSNFREYVKMQDDPKFRQKVLDRVIELLTHEENHEKMSAEMLEANKHLLEERVQTRILLKPEDLHLIESPPQEDWDGKEIRPAIKYFGINDFYLDNPAIQLGYEGKRPLEEVHKELIKIFSDEKLFGIKGECLFPRLEPEFGGGFDKISSVDYVEKEGAPRKLTVEIREYTEAEDSAQILKIYKCPTDISGLNFHFEVRTWGKSPYAWRNYKPLMEALAEKGFSFALYGQGADVQCYHMVRGREKE